MSAVAASFDSSMDWIFHDELSGETMDLDHEIMTDNMMEMPEPIYDWGPDPDLTKDETSTTSSTTGSSSPKAKRRRTRKTTVGASKKKTSPRRKRTVLVTTYKVLRTPLSFFWSMGKV